MFLPGSFFSEPNPPSPCLRSLPVDRCSASATMAPKAAPKRSQHWVRRTHPTVGVTGDTQATGADHWMVPTMRRLEEPAAVPGPSRGPVPDSNLQAQRWALRRVTGLLNAGFSPGRHIDFVMGRPVLVRAACLSQACSSARLHSKCEPAAPLMQFSAR